MGFFLVIGLVVSGFALVNLAAQIRFVRRSVLTTGTVVRLEQLDGEGIRRFNQPLAPVVQFVSDQGRQVEFKGNDAFNPPRHRIGQQIRARYDPAKPEIAFVAGTVYLGPALAMVIGIACIGFDSFLILRGFGIV